MKESLFLPIIWGIATAAAAVWAVYALFFEGTRPGPAILCTLLLALCFFRSVKRYRKGGASGEDTPEPGRPYRPYVDLYVNGCNCRKKM